MRRLLNQAANAAVKTKGSIFEIVYRRSVPRLGHNQAIGAIAHRQCCLIWLILHQRVRYEERPSGHETIEAKAHCENDPPTPHPRLSDRTTESSTQPSTSAVIFEPVSSFRFRAHLDVSIPSLSPASEAITPRFLDMAPLI